MSQHKSTYSLVMAEVNITGRYFMWYGGEGVLQYYTHSDVFFIVPLKGNMHAIITTTNKHKPSKLGH